MSKLVYGFGVVDLDYPKTKKLNGVILWRCKIFDSWTNMLQRCYSETRAKETPFLGKPNCSQDWKYFSKFKSWVESSYWEGLHLDKDVLVQGNREYGPTTCAFVPRYVNNILQIKQMSRGEYPLGVRRIEHWRQRQYQCRVGNKSIGYFYTPAEAHAAWQIARAAYIENTIARYAKEDCFRTDVAEALTSRVWGLRLENALGKETVIL